MFVGLKDIAAARGRVALMGGVVALITLLLVMLTGLTGGLARQNTSALDALGADYPDVVFSTEEPSFTQSHFEGVPAGAPAGTTPLAVTQTRVGDEPAAVLALPAGADSPVGPIPADGIVASRALGLSEGQSVQVSGRTTTVVAVADDLYYSHVPVAWTALDGPATVLLARADGSADAADAADAAAAAVPGAPTAVPMRTALSGLPAYSSEHGSLLTMQGFLYAISALVTVAFLTVWTIQRTRDLSILRAHGAAGRYLLRDALGQAAVLLGGGVAVGGLAGLGLGWLAARAVPFELSAATVLVPVVGIWALGMLGALVATRRVTRINPLLALGGTA